MLSFRGRRTSVLLGQCETRACLVQPVLHDVLGRVRQRQFAIFGAGRAAWECGQKYLERPRATVEGQAEGMIGKQASCVRPVAGRLQVANRVNRLRVMCKPVRGQFVQLRDVSGASSAQLEPKQLAEQLVVSEPRTRWIQ